MFAISVLFMLYIMQISIHTRYYTDFLGFPLKFNVGVLVGGIAGGLFALIVGGAVLVTILIIITLMHVLQEKR